MGYPLTVQASAIKIHDPLHSVQGGQFRGGYDLVVPRHCFVGSPIKGKVAKVYRLKTRCEGVKVPRTTDYAQLTITEETIIRGDRHATGFRLFIARFVPRAEFHVKGPDKAYRHIEPDTIFGSVYDFVHIAATDNARLKAILGI